MSASGEVKEGELGPAAAYSAQVAAWLQQAHHAQLLQHSFSAFLAHQSLQVTPRGW